MQPHFEEPGNKSGLSLLRGIESTLVLLRKNYFTEIMSVLVIAGMLGVFFTSYATTNPRTKPLIYQGRLTDSSYIPVGDGARKMKFRLYDAATGGTCKWATGNNCSSPAAIDVSVQRGVFTVALGSGSPADNPVFSYDFNDANTYLEVQICALAVADQSSCGATDYDTLSPRTRIAASSYAFNADELDGLDSTSFLRIDGATTQTGATSGTPTAIAFRAGSHSGLANAEVIDVHFDLDASSRLITFTGGGDTITQQRAFVIDPPTYSADAAQAFGTVATAAISGAPAFSGSNIDELATLRALLWLQGNNLRRGAALHINYPSAVTMLDWVLGTNINLSNIVVDGSTANQLLDGQLITLPSATTTAATAVSMYGNRITSTTTSGGTGIINTNNASGATYWWGQHITIPTLSETAGTTLATGLQINGTQVNSGATSYALVTNALAGNIGFGNTTPDYRLEVSSPTATAAQFAISAADFDSTTGANTALTLADGFTIQEDTYFNIQELQGGGGAGTGGAWVIGASSHAATPGMLLQGIIGNNVDPTATTAALMLRGDRTNSSDTRTALAADDIILQVANNSTVYLTMLGNGNVGIGNSVIAPTALLQLGGATTVSRAAPGTNGAWLSVPAATLQDTSTAQGGNAGNQAFNVFGTPTYSAANTGVTVDHASNVYISNPPQIGSLGGITNSSALRIAGASNMFAITNIHGIYIDPVTASFGVTNAYGIYANQPTGATNNYTAIFEGNTGTPLVGIGTAMPGTTLEVDGSISFGAIESVTIDEVTDTIGVSASTHLGLNNPTGSLINLSSANTVANGTTGQMIFLIGDSGTSDIQINDGNNVQLGAVSRTIGPNDVLHLIYNGADWLEVSFSDN